jgi:cell division protein FtsB
MARKPVVRLSGKDVVVVSLLTIFLIWLIYLNVGIYQKEKIAQAAAHDTASQLVGLQTREKALQQNVNELSTERGQEATLRDTFGVARPGEGEIIIVPPNAATTTPPVSFWQKYFGWLEFWKYW